jgi:hypothetical protein
MSNAAANLQELVRRGSSTARGGFQNEDEVVRKFNDWEIDEDAQNWLEIMHYDLEDIERVEAVKVTGSYKTDVQVIIKIYLKNALSSENISVKLVSNPQGFNQIDKRWVKKYAELWAIPEDIVHILKLYTGETEPTKANLRDPRRMYFDEMPPESVEKMVDFFSANKVMIITDVLRGRDRLPADWMLIYQKPANIWTLLPISVVMNYYASGSIMVTLQGNLRIGRIGMQRKGGDNGRETANMLQFKINPCEIVKILNQ